MILIKNKFDIILKLLIINYINLTNLKFNVYYIVNKIKCSFCVYVSRETSKRIYIIFLKKIKWFYDEKTVIILNKLYKLYNLFPGK